MSDDQPIRFAADEDMSASPSNEPISSDIPTGGASGPDQLQRLTVELLMSTSKSMESIALDVPRLEDSDGVTPTRTESEDDAETELEKALAESESHATEVTPVTEQTTDKRVADISSYFQTQAENQEISRASSAADFFDKLPRDDAPDAKQSAVDPLCESMSALSTDLTPEVLASDEDQPECEATTPELSPPRIVHPDAVEVQLAEEKGEGLRPTPSTKNLTRFFSDDTVVKDVAGREFFEAFTAAEEPRLPRSPHISLSESDHQLLPPETPPISASLQVSPLHHASTSSQPDHCDSSTPSFNDDPFSAILQASDLDRRHDAWIASEATQQSLVSVVTGSGGMSTQDSQLPVPRFVVDTSLGDPIYEHVLRFLGEQEASKRETRTADSVSQDEIGLRQLISSYCWRAAVDLTAHLLAECGQGNSAVGQPVHHTPYSLQLWFVRISLFAKLHMYVEAEAECESFGNLDAPQFYFEFYSDEYSGRRGSMVPFHFRVLHAELPQYNGKQQESLDKLYYLHAVVLKIKDNLLSGLAEDGSVLQLNEDSRTNSLELWESREIRLLYAIGNCALILKDYAVTVRIFESLLEKDVKNKEHLLSGIGRIYVQMGDMVTAEQYFTQASCLSDPDSQDDKSRNTVNRGLLALGYSQFKEAYQMFREATSLQPDNTVATNNMAVCALYMGQLPDALNTLETLVLSDPTRFLQEGILFNLCTLYELQSSHAIRKKEMLLQLVNRHCGNGFNVACLKMA